MVKHMNEIQVITCFQYTGFDLIVFFFLQMLDLNIIKLHVVAVFMFNDKHQKLYPTKLNNPFVDIFRVSLVENRVCGKYIHDTDLNSLDTNTR